VTKCGEPIAEVVPASRLPRAKRELGALSASGAITGEIVGPVVEESDSETLHG
jgi:antitoxin (DNA-binding transcriptional repressor) of toxin-antitoxin stability system